MKPKTESNEQTMTLAYKHQVCDAGQLGIHTLINPFKQKDRYVVRLTFR